MIRLAFSSAAHLLKRDVSRFLQKPEALHIGDGRLQMQAQGRAYDALAAYELTTHLSQRGKHVLDAGTRCGNATVALFLRWRDARVAEPFR